VFTRLIHTLISSQWVCYSRTTSLACSALCWL